MSKEKKIEPPRFRKEGLREYEEQQHNDSRVFPTSITDPATYVKKFIQLNNLRS